MKGASSACRCSLSCATPRRNRPRTYLYGVVPTTCGDRDASGAGHPCLSRGGGGVWESEVVPGLVRAHAAWRGASFRQLHALEHQIRRPFPLGAKGICARFPTNGLANLSFVWPSCLCRLAALCAGEGGPKLPIPTIALVGGTAPCGSRDRARQAERPRFSQRCPRPRPPSTHSRCRRGGSATKHTDVRHIMCQQRRVRALRSEVGGLLRCCRGGARLGSVRYEQRPAAQPARVAVRRRCAARPNVPRHVQTEKCQNGCSGLGV